MRFPTMWDVRPAKAQIRLCIPFASRLIMTVKLLTEHHFDCVSLNGACTGSSESKLVNMPHCWKSHVAAQI